MAQTRVPAVLNTLTGKLNEVRVSDAGLETVTLADGPRQARRFVYSGDLSVESWYDLDGTLGQAALPAKDGSTIEYLCSSLRRAHGHDRGRVNTLPGLIWITGASAGIAGARLAHGPRRVARRRQRATRR